MLKYTFVALAAVRVCTGHFLKVWTLCYKHPIKNNIFFIIIIFLSFNVICIHSNVILKAVANH